MKLLSNLWALGCATAMGLSTLTVGAQTATTDPAMVKPSPSEELPWIEAEVRKVDHAAKKITLKHADIPHLDMPSMTMVFQAKEAGQLVGLKPGDRVKFRADKLAGAYVAWDFQPLR